MKLITGQKVDEKGNPFFECPRCGKASHNMEDRHEGYCGVCKFWTGNAELEKEWQRQNAEATKQSLVQDRDDVQR